MRLFLNLVCIRSLSLTLFRYKQDKPFYMSTAIHREWYVQYYPSTTRCHPQYSLSCTFTLVKELKGRVEAKQITMTAVNAMGEKRAVYVSNNFGQDALGLECQVSYCLCRCSTLLVLKLLDDILNAVKFKLL